VAPPVIAADGLSVCLSIVEPGRDGTNHLLAVTLAMTTTSRYGVPVFTAAVADEGRMGHGETSSLMMYEPACV
jgi:hypothetical protein